jgi:MFS transporter, PAT family, beta-lactamase induction signal transducer AmpG
MGQATSRFPRGSLLVVLGLLYWAQGVPYGLAAEYMPVVLRKAGYSQTAIAALFWLQLPWQLKVLWARLGDHPALRPKTPAILRALQATCALLLCLCAFADLAVTPVLWFSATFCLALVAATQDIFVDALAVRSLAAEERGYGNIAQVAGYRLGILSGGAGLLLGAAALGTRQMLFVLAALVALSGFFVSAARGSRTEQPAPAITTKAAGAAPRSRLAFILRHALQARARAVLAVAIVFKLGLHLASGLFKPMVVDAGWSNAEIGGAVVTVGTIASLVGAAAGGALHRWLSEPRALMAATVLQTMACAPLIAVARLGAPHMLTTGCLAVEHFASGAGTTVLFAALMTATRKDDAALHYTVLSAANGLGLGLGGLVGAQLADHWGRPLAFGAATLLCLWPLWFLRRWNEAAAASAA